MRSNAARFNLRGARAEVMDRGRTETSLVTSSGCHALTRCKATGSGDAVQVGRASLLEPPRPRTVHPSPSLRFAGRCRMIGYFPGSICASSILCTTFPQHPNLPVDRDAVVHAADSRSRPCGAFRLLALGP